jgi:catecholate siderophore receptor
MKDSQLIAIVVFGLPVLGFPVIGVAADSVEPRNPQVLPGVTVEATAYGYRVGSTTTATRTPTQLRDVPQAITVVTQEQVKDQQLLSIGDVVRYLPGISAHQGENNRDQIVIRGNSSSADFFRDGIRDDVQYYRDLYNLEQLEALRGPNAMIFGRGGGGGVVNRVIKQAGFRPSNQVSLLGGSYGEMRSAIDVNQPLNNTVAMRLNAVYEQSDTFRNGVDNLRRYGINPTLTYAPDERTRLMLGYEYFHDQRTADRGIPSFAGRPANLDIATYFGNPNDSQVHATVNLASALIEHDFGSWNLRNRTLLGDYSRGYQNYVPGAINAAQTLVAITAYNNATDRSNLFNQTDASFTLNTGAVRHQLLVGMELGRQRTDNFRNTGYFNNTATSFNAPLSNPVIATPVSFRQSATDANNHLNTDVAGLYAQDQAQLTGRLQLIAGVRFDRFKLDYRDNRTGLALERSDSLTSPRVGLVYKPATPLSIYASYSVSFLPGSGDQFSSLTTITQQLEPEKFRNHELGLKWDVARELALTAAVYRLDRSNTRSTDPNNPALVIQTGSQRTNGFELGLTGKLTSTWKAVAGYAYQDAYITSATAAAAAGRQVGQVPHNQWSLWNMVQATPRIGLGLGVLNRSAMFAAVDDTVILPGYTRVDGAVFYSVTDRIRLQANVENVFDRRYYTNADGNNNISPGSPRALRVGLTAQF